MNIYKYIRSKDVREYNEKIGHKFTAAESAFLVWLNYEIFLAAILTRKRLQKHARLSKAGRNKSRNRLSESFGRVERKIRN